jgi:hypothetical protein
MGPSMEKVNVSDISGLDLRKGLHVAHFGVMKWTFPKLALCEISYILASQRIPSTAICGNCGSAKTPNSAPLLHPIESAFRVAGE